MKTKIIPFDLETANKIQAGEIEGRIVTSRGFRARLLATDLDCYHCLAVAYFEGQIEDVGTFDKKGNYWNEEFAYRNLHIELPEEAPICNNPDSPICKVCSNIHCNDCQYNAPKHEFKPFDKVLVRHYDVSVWQPAFFWKFFDELSKTPYYTIDGNKWEQCIQFEGNQVLIGTTDKPKED